MHIQQKVFLSLLKSGLCGKPADIKTDFSAENILETALKHHTDTLIYYGLKNSNVKIPENIMTFLHSRVLSLATLDIKQQYQIEQIYKHFNENGIDYMPLKGAILKHIYPGTEMRYMGDIDILIRPSQYDAVKQIMQELDFSFILESNHEYVFKKMNTLKVELHKMLIPSYNEDYFKYYGDGWQLAQDKTEKGYVMKDEDFFIYAFTHLAKHYRDKGIGIKHFIDLWVFLSAKPQLDFTYIEQELKKLQLIKFYQNTIKMLNVWFDDAKEDDISIFMTQWIFSGGAYGTDKNLYISSALKESKSRGGKGGLKLKILLKKVFPPYSVMKQIYPVLKKVPVLFPFLWFLRIADIILFKRSKFKDEKLKMETVTKDSLSDYEKALNLVGLNFNFGE